MSRLPGRWGCVERVTSSIVGDAGSDCCDVIMVTSVVIDRGREGKGGVISGEGRRKKRKGGCL